MLCLFCFTILVFWVSSLSVSLFIFLLNWEKVSRGHWIGHFTKQKIIVNEILIFLVCLKPHSWRARSNNWMHYVIYSTTTRQETSQCPYVVLHIGNWTKIGGEHNICLLFVTKSQFWHFLSILCFRVNTVQNWRGGGGIKKPNFKFWWNLPD